MNNLKEDLVSTQFKKSINFELAIQFLSFADTRNDSHKIVYTFYMNVFIESTELIIKDMSHKVYVESSIVRTKEF